MPTNLCRKSGKVIEPGRLEVDRLILLEGWFREATGGIRFEAPLIIPFARMLSCEQPARLPSYIQVHWAASADFSIASPGVGSSQASLWRLLWGYGWCAVYLPLAGFLNEKSATGRDRDWGFR